MVSLTVNGKAQQVNVAPVAVNPSLPGTRIRSLPIRKDDLKRA